MPTMKTCACSCHRDDLRSVFMALLLVSILVFGPALAKSCNERRACIRYEDGSIECSIESHYDGRFRWTSQELG
jgi:hypothetical protein